MDALSLLLQRRSWAKLTEPAPSGQALDNILKAGMRAPDHGGLCPWHFTLVRGEGRDKLAAIFELAMTKKQQHAAKIEKAAKAPMRAPLIIIVSTRLQEHEKVPEIEQVMATACTVQAMQMAAMAQGFQGIWRTGDFAYDAHIKQALGIEDKEHIVAYLYLGTPENMPEKIRTVNYQSVLSEL